LSKSWSPKDLRSTKHLLDEHHSIQKARIAKNAAAGCWLPYKPGLTYGAARDYEIWTLGDKVRDSDHTTLNPYRLALDEFWSPQRSVG
jgi:hypothetical protein